MASAPMQSTPGHLLKSSPSWLEMVRARWYVLGISTLLGAGGGWLWASNQPKVYEAQATLEFELGQGNFATETTSAAQGVEASVSVSQELVRTQVFLLKSRSLAERVVHKLRLDKQRSAARKGALGDTAITQQPAITEVQSAVDVLPVPGTRIVMVRARAATPSAAAKLANALVDAYLERSQEDRTGTSSRALEWLRTEEASLENEVEASELAVFKFREEHEDLSASLVERRALLTEQRTTYNASLTELRIKRVHAQARVAVLKEALSPPADPLMVQAGPIASDPIVRSMRERYWAAEARFQALTASLSDDSPQLTAAQTDVDKIRRGLILQLEAILEGAQTDLKEIERAESGIQRALADLKKQSVELSREELEFASLERQHASRVDRYSAVLERMAKADLTRALAASIARVVDRAVAPTHPTRGLLQRATAVGALCGLSLAAWITLVVSASSRKREGAQRPPLP